MILQESWEDEEEEKKDEEKVESVPPPPKPKKKIQDKIAEKEVSYFRFLFATYNHHLNTISVSIFIFRN